MARGDLRRRGAAAAARADSTPPGGAAPRAAGRRGWRWARLMKALGGGW